ncbi:MAG: HAMP domain-containing histidine kinase [Burkholderiales bacterium]|nr:HAMP domain-containing histidine kinase [Burkholderiales bacterium]MDE1926606.1 HAMP domain-containing histidine kinase [Burkholderiales bacterium]MDE2160102.1 HAMP domain-containing histidine kinase [Burkholderiales bacterium]MDE2504158.1 HAMP domain-containing histidine kinase [Burkholderiales bacterium]
MQEPAASAADLAEQRRFVAYVGHEIRSALASVMGVNSLLLLESRLDPRQSRYVSLATQSVRSALALVNDILDMAKLEAGRFDILCQPVDIARLARELTSEFEVLALEKGLRLVCDAPTELPEVQADGRRLRQVLSNLLGNALKFTDAGHVTVRVQRREAAAGMACVHIAVEDTGAGISAEDLPLLFSEFSQIGSGSAQREAGSGLGLALSRQLLRRMGSELQVRSRTGAGSTFWFTFTAPLAGTGDGDQPTADPWTPPDVDPALPAPASGWPPGAAAGLRLGA